MLSYWSSVTYQLSLKSPESKIVSKVELPETLDISKLRYLKYSRSRLLCAFLRSQYLIEKKPLEACWDDAGVLRLHYNFYISWKRFQYWPDEIIEKQLVIDRLINIEKYNSDIHSTLYRNFVFRPIFKDSPLFQIRESLVQKFMDELCNCLNDVRLNFDELYSVLLNTDEGCRENRLIRGKALPLARGTEKFYDHHWIMNKMTNLYGSGMKPEMLNFAKRINRYG